MSKARDIRLHEELLGKLDIIFCQLQTLSGAVRLLGADKVKRDQPSQESANFWEMQCRQKDAALNETLKELDRKEAALVEAQRRLLNGFLYKP